MIASVVGGPLSARDAGEDARGAVLELLVEARSGAPVDPAAFTRLGSGALEATLDLLARSESGERSFHLATPLRGLLVESVAHYDSGAVRRLIRAAGNARPSRSERAVLLELLGRVGTHADFDLAVALALGDPGSDEFPLGLEVEDAVQRILRRDVSRARKLSAFFMEENRPILPDLARAVGNAGGTEAVRLLYQLLRFEPNDVAWILPEIGRAAKATSSSVDEQVRSEVAFYLEHDDGAVRREASLALGRMGAFEATPQLVAVLEGGHDGAARAAHWALQELTGLRFSADPQRWRAWLGRELEWWESEYPELRAALATGEPDERMSALRQLGLRRLFSDELVAEACAHLNDRLPAVRGAACVALAGLRARSASSELILLLEDLDASVAAEAWRTLKIIHDLDLPPDPEAWSETVLDVRLDR